MKDFSWLRFIQNESIIIGPSDTIDSIYSTLQNRHMIKKVKERSDKKPFILLCSNVNMLMKYIEWPREKKEIEKKIRQDITPTTRIYKAGKTLKEKFDWEFKTVGIRVPKNRDLCLAIEKVGYPIISTSFNSFFELEKIKEGEARIINGVKTTFYCIKELGVIDRPSKLISTLSNKEIKRERKFHKS